MGKLWSDEGPLSPAIPIGIQRLPTLADGALKSPRLTCSELEPNPDTWSISGFGCGIVLTLKFTLRESVAERMGASNVRACPRENFRIESR